MLFLDGRLIGYNIINEKLQNYHIDATSACEAAATIMRQQHICITHLHAQGMEIPCSDAELQFAISIQDTPNNICVCCHRLCFEYQLTPWCDELLNNLTPVERLTFLDKRIMCSSCHACLKKHQRLPLCLATGLTLNEIIPEVQCLHPLEARLISPRLNFVQIKQIPMIGQPHVHGSVIKCSYRSTVVSNDITSYVR